MKICCRFLCFLAVVYVFQFFYLSSASAELIGPTRNLEGKTEAKGRLTVLSEPPGYKISLDGKRLGKTPAFLVQVKPGIHKLRVRNLETEIYLQAGTILKISLFKNEFIQIPVEAKVTEKEQPDLQQQRHVSTSPAVQPSPAEVRIQENRNRAKERWMRFVDGSSPAF